MIQAGKAGSSLSSPNACGVFWMKALLILSIGLAVAWIVSAILPRSSPGDALRYFDESFLEQSSRRAKLSYVATGLEAIATFVTLYLFVERKMAQASVMKISSTEMISPRRALYVGAVLAVECALLLFVVQFPFRLYKGHFLEKVFGLSRLSFLGWLAEVLKGTVLEMLVYAALGGGAAFLIVRFPSRWQYLLTLVFFVGSLVITYIYPLVIAPLFDRFVLLEDPVLLEEIEALTQKAGLSVDKVLVMEASRKTARTNAYFTGIGASRQVVLYDTLIETRPIEEVKLVLAHELGHWKMGHLMKGIVLSAFSTFIAVMVFSFAFGLTRQGFSALDFERVFLCLILFFVLASYVTTPISSLVSRKHEIEADMFSLEITCDPESFTSAMVGLARANLSDVCPPPFIRWFAFSHPTTMERIALAEQFENSPSYTKIDY